MQTAVAAARSSSKWNRQKRRVWSGTRIASGASNVASSLTSTTTKATRARFTVSHTSRNSSNRNRLKSLNNLVSRSPRMYAVRDTLVVQLRATISCIGRITPAIRSLELKFQLGSGRLGSARVGTARHGSARFGTVPLDPAPPLFSLNFSDGNLGARDHTAYV